MNDRPITPVSSVPKDLEALTPNHILDTFWERWTEEYLPTLQETQKWLKKMPKFSVCGDLVLMVVKDVPAGGQWPKALVEQVFPDSEGIVRRVTNASPLITELYLIYLEIGLEYIVSQQIITSTGLGAEATSGVTTMG